VAVNGSHPLGWFFLAVAGVAGFGAVKGVIAERVKTYEFQGAALTALHWIVPRRKFSAKIKESETTARDVFSSTIHRQLITQRDRYFRYAEAVTRDALRQAGILERLEKAA
jgi:hypothetical protein